MGLLTFTPWCQKEFFFLMRLSSREVSDYPLVRPNNNSPDTGACLYFQLTLVS
jgi:hypothetical protein